MDSARAAGFILQAIQDSDGSCSLLRMVEHQECYGQLVWLAFGNDDILNIELMKSAQRQQSWLVNA